MTEPKRTKRIEGYTRQQRNRRILAQSNICHICGEPGADGIDHVVPLARGGTEKRSNLMPAHTNVPNSLGVRCNYVKGSKAYAPIVRRSRSLD